LTRPGLIKLTIAGGVPEGSARVDRAGVGQGHERHEIRPFHEKHEKNLFYTF
jgi:hypothetical protein